MTFALVAPAPAGVPTGGHVYNDRLIREWAAMGVPVAIERVQGDWPRPSADERARLRSTLTRHPVVLVDGLVGGACPDEVEAAEAAGTRVVVLVHLPLPAEPGLTASEHLRLTDTENRALHAASGVVAVSPWAARDLHRRYGLRHVRVALPGADREALAVGSTPPHLLVLAAFTPGKNHATLLSALERLEDLQWSAAFVGRRAVDGEAADAWDGRAASSPVRSRIEVPGPLVGAALEAQWTRTDLLVLPSRVETYGLVVTEAFAHGIPAVVGAGTGAVETLTGDGVEPPPGATADPRDQDAIAEVLRAFLADAKTRDGWRRQALIRRERLRPWSATARDVLDALALFTRSGD